jgi:uncharacterized protein
MADNRRVVVAGASGLIGRRLVRELIARGYRVVVFSRDAEAARRKVPGAAEYVAWDAGLSGAWAQAIDGAYGVVNLAGASIFGHRWTDAYKQELRESRIVGTRGLVQAMAAAQAKPEVFVSGSAVGYYGFRDATKLDESAAPGDDFLARLCVEWEAEAQRAEGLGVRTVLARTGIVLDRDEGALPQLVLPFKLFAGGPIMPGSQYLSWVHIADAVGLLLLALEDERAQGPLNATAPRPETNRDFSRALGGVLGRPSWLPVPGLGLSALLGEFGETLTEGQRVLPAKALALGYRFRFPELLPALQDLLG